MNASVSVSQVSSMRWSLEEDLRLYERAGIRRVGVLLSKLEAAGGQGAGVRRVRDAGLRVDAVYAGASLVLRERGGWPAWRGALLAALEAADQLGAGGVLFLSGGAQGLAYEAAADAFAEAIEPLAAQLRPGGPGLWLETAGTAFAGIGFVHTLADAGAIARRHDLRLVVDVAHSWWEPRLHARLAELAGLIGLVQVADLAFGARGFERVVPGDGQLDVRGICAALLAAGYRGPFELEVLGRAIEEEGYDSAVPRGAAALGELLDGL